MKPNTMEAVETIFPGATWTRVNSVTGAFFAQIHHQDLKAPLSAAADLSGTVRAWISDRRWTGGSLDEVLAAVAEDLRR